MSLINELLWRPLDPGYEAAARRRTQAREAAPRWGRSPWVIVTALLLGVMFAIAATTLRVPPGAAAKDRAALEERIDARRVAVDAREVHVRQQQSAVAALEAPALVGGAASTNEAAAATAVYGPGLMITLDDAPRDPVVAPDGDPRTTQNVPGRIVARDLQAVTNALWACGAEGISINGLRLTSTTSIRFAGAAILVGYRPLTRPYTVAAVAGPDAVKAFERGDGGAYLDELRRAYQARAELAQSPKVHLPAGSILDVRAARIPDSRATTSPTPASGANP